MQTHIDERVAIAINALASAFKRELSPAMILAYASSLKGIDPEQIENAIQNAVQTHRFMPSPSELRAIALEQDDLESQAILAWTTVLQSISRYGWYRSVDFEDKAINATIHTMGGWQYLCERATNANLPFLRKDFLAIYMAFVKRGVPQSLERHLEGEFEKQNAILGFQRNEANPILIASCNHKEQESVAKLSSNLDLPQRTGDAT